MRPNQVALLAEDGRQTAARPFEIGVFQADREGHFSLDALDAQQREHGDQVGIGLFIKDKEARIDRMRFALQRDVDRIGVAAEISARLE